MEFVLATLFAVVAGFGTAFSPCVLPVLPLALTGAATGGRRRPLGIAVGLAGSFAFATLALAYVIAALGLPDDLLRTLAVVSLLVFGTVLLVPPLAARVEAWSSRMVPQRTAGLGREGFGGGVVLGASLGLLYVPCAGPVLAAVLTVQASQELSAQRLVTGLGYAVGTAAGVLIVLLAGRRVLSRLRARSGRFQQALGLVMVVFAVLTLGGVDGRFRRVVADALPSWLVNPTKGIEESQAVASALGREAPHPGLQDGGPAPEITGTQQWFNSRPLTLKSLRGRVVLVDFWTYTCINCIRTQPYLKAWDARYRDDGLTIIGVHTPEFAFERDAGNVARAVREAGIEYPVAQDNEFTVWNAFHNQFWPAKYLIDARGHLRYAHFGEGDYEQTEAAIRALLAEAGEATRDPRATIDAQRPSRAVQTPETYVGADRSEGFLPPTVAGARDYGPLPAPASLRLNEFSFGGRWRVGSEDGEAVSGARLRAHFAARRVFLVMGADRPSDVRVALDGRAVRTVRVREQDIYTLLDLPRAREGVLTLDLDPGVRAYAFTFG
jgi:cytochrome c biogenesis protein CcdA/thiol-disulfide isomerase/thioredoxin